MAAAPCPDPSAHEPHNKLSAQASTAALYVTHPERATNPKEPEREHPLGPDGKLSAKSAAASLKYAKPQDLPSFPSSGNTASSASAAALLAKDYKMKELWQPGDASAAASRASMLAAKDGGKLDLWQASPSAAGNSAATLAMKNKGLSPEIDRGYTADGKNRALLAATLSVNKGRDSAAAPSVATPAAYPDSHNATANALNAATVSHRTSTLKADGWDSEANQAARVKNAHMDKAMFGDRPPVEIELEEKRYNAALHASAVTMAKQMYDYQNKQAALNDLTGSAEGAQAAHARQASSSSTDIKQEAMRYINLQDAAHKLAQERLAKVDKSMEDQRYREYYGYEGSPKKSLSNRLSVRGRPRNRDSADGGDPDDSDDEQNARRIRSQMSQLNSGLSSVSDKKRTDDRAKLLAAAEKRVHAQMHDMDERVFQETGKVPPAMMEEWEAKARERQKKEKELQAANPGKTHIGGGKFIDQAEIEAIAAARLKPTLDEINDTAEKRRARDEELRLEKEAQERERWVEKQDKKEAKQEQKRIHNEEKAAEKKRRDEEKAAQKKIKDEEKARKDEEKRIADEQRRIAKEQKDAQKEAERAQKEAEKAEKAEKRKSKVVPAAVVGGAAGAGAAEAVEEREAHEAAEPEAKESKVEKRNSVLGRVTSKFKRRSKAPDADEKAALAETDQESKIDDKKEKSTAVPVAGGLLAGAGAAAGGAAIAAHEDHEETKDEPPPLVRAHTGNHTDAIQLPAVEDSGKPDLERHISTIDTSEDDEDEDRLKKRTNREAIAVAPAPVSPIEDEVAEPAPSSEHQKSTVVAAPIPVQEQTAVGSSLSEPFDEPAQVTQVPEPEPVPEPVVEKKPEVALAQVSQAPESAEKSREVLAPVSPATSQTADVTAKPISEAVPETAKVESFQEAAEQKAVEEDAVKPQTSNEKAKPIAGRGGGIGIAGYDTGEPKPYTGPAPNTIGPHKSDIANILDPRVLPVPELMKERGTAGPHKSDMLNILDPRVESDPVKAAEKGQSNEPREHTKLHKRGASDVKFSSEKKEEKSKKGVRGFMNKLRKRESKTDNKLEKEEKTAVTGASAPGPAETSEAAAVTTSKDVSPINPEEESNVITNPGSVSPSSFRRHDGGLNDLDDVSSSGLEEEDYERGRSGRLAKKLGLAGKKGKGKAAVTDDRSESNEDDQFEEARDHFDESLAPPPAFAGQAKSVSPVRDTHFKEML